MDGMGWDGMGWDGMGWDGMGRNGMGWDGKKAEWHRTEQKPILIYTTSRPSCTTHDKSPSQAGAGPDRATREDGREEGRKDEGKCKSSTRVEFDKINIRSFPRFQPSYANASYAS